MDSREYLYFVQKEIHSTVMATVDNDGFPVTCAIDIMDCDGKFIFPDRPRKKPLRPAKQARLCSIDRYEGTRYSVLCSGLDPR